jgi:hypothetical protein
VDVVLSPDGQTDILQARKQKWESHRLGEKQVGSLSVGSGVAAAAADKKET